MKTKLPLIAMLFGMFAFAQLPGDIIVSEIMIDPNGDERVREWFEVYNTTSAAIDMNGWTILDKSSNGRAHVITSPAPVMVPAGAYAVLANSTDVLLNGGMTAAANNIIYVYSYNSPVGGPATPGVGTDWPTWNNETTYSGGSTNDDGIGLESATGVLIDEILYGFGYAGLNAWPAQGAPQFTSYQLDASTLDNASNDVAANWLESTAIYGTDGAVGTPGLANFSAGGTAALGAGDIVITELMIDPDGTEANTEWFEVYNTTSSPIDMMGWTIGDDSSSSRIHEITTSVVVAAGSYAVFAPTSDATLNDGITNVAYAYGFNSPVGGPVDLTGADFPRFNNESSFNDSNQTDNETDGIILSSDTGLVIDEVLYDYGYGTAPIGWPAQGTSGGASWESNTFDDVANNMSAAWDRATATYGSRSTLQQGTPGVRNTLSVSTASLGTIKLYPNPSQDFISITMDNGQWNSLQVYNVTGQVVMNVTNYTERVNVTSLNTGTYFVKVNASQGSETIQFLVK